MRDKKGKENNVELSHVIAFVVTNAFSISLITFCHGGSADAQR